MKPAVCCATARLRAGATALGRALEGKTATAEVMGSALRLRFGAVPPAAVQL